MFPAPAIWRGPSGFTDASRRPGGGTQPAEHRPILGLSCQTLPAMLLKVVLRLLPSKPHAAMHTTATSAAISPYSMAVTPASSLIRFMKIVHIVILLELRQAQGRIRTLMKA